LRDILNKKRFSIREPTAEKKNPTGADRREIKNMTGESSTENTKPSIGEEFKTENPTDAGRTFLRKEPADNYQDMLRKE
jgi:hypothetical protein